MPCSDENRVKRANVTKSERLAHNQPNHPNQLTRTPNPSNPMGGMGLHTKTSKTMAIRYKVIPRKSPKDRSVKYYGVQRSTQMSASQFIENIVQTNTVTRADVLAVLASIKQELVNCIRNGQSVTLGEIGTFRFTIKTRGAETKDKFVADNIKKVSVRFLPSSEFKYDTSRENPNVTFLHDEPAEEEG